MCTNTRRELTVPACHHHPLPQFCHPATEAGQHPGPSLTAPPDAHTAHVASSTLSRTHSRPAVAFAAEAEPSTVSKVLNAPRRILRGERRTHKHTTTSYCLHHQACRVLVFMQPSQPALLTRPCIANKQHSAQQSSRSTSKLLTPVPPFTAQALIALLHPVPPLPPTGYAHAWSGGRGGFYGPGSYGGWGYGGWGYGGLMMWPYQENRWVGLGLSQTLNPKP